MSMHELREQTFLAAGREGKIMGSEKYQAYLRQQK